MQSGQSAKGPSAPPGFLLAAGLGRRMRPLTDDTPKPLLTVGGRTLLDHAVDRLLAAGIRRIVVNAHHLAEQVHEWALIRAAHDDLTIQVSHEDALLETAGGLLHALPMLGLPPVLAANGDALWLDLPGSPGAVQRLIAAFDPVCMDALLLLTDRREVLGYSGPGDFELDPDGRLIRRDADATAPWLYAGVQMVGTGLLDGAPSGPMSFNPLWDQAIARGRLYGLVHTGELLHIGDPDALAAAQARFGG